MPSAAQTLDRSRDDVDDSTVKIDMRAARRAQPQPPVDYGATMEIDLSATQIDTMLTGGLTGGLTDGSVATSDMTDDDSTVEIPALGK